MRHLRILIIDDHALFRSGLSMLLRTSFSGAEITEARSINEAYLIQLTPPDLVLLDLTLADGDGMDAIRPMQLKWPKSSVVVVSADNSTEATQKAEQRGCEAFIFKSESPTYLLAIIRRLLGKRMEAAGTTAGEEVSPNRSPLTSRQEDVLALLSEGLTNRAIGKRLNVSENTVRAHISAILRSLQAETRTEALAAARRLGLMQ
jgi:DNA-binding NarL/FixJ family response regulator